MVNTDKYNPKPVCSKENTPSCTCTGICRCDEAPIKSDNEIGRPMHSKLSSVAQTNLHKIIKEAETLTDGGQHYTNSQGEVASVTSSWKSRFKVAKSSIDRFSASASGGTIPTLKSSLWDSTLRFDAVKIQQLLRSGVGVTLYDHFSEIIHEVIGNRLTGAVDYVEALSKDIKERRFINQKGDYLRDVFEIPKNLCEVQKVNSLYKTITEELESAQKFEELKSSSVFSEKISEVSGVSSESKEPDVLRVPDFIESNNFFRQAGFGLPDWEIFDLTVSITRFVNKMKNVFSKLRFFGKIFGHHGLYYVLETELTLKEVERWKRIEFERGAALLAGKDVGEGDGEGEREREGEREGEVYEDDLGEGSLLATIDEETLRESIATARLSEDSKALLYEMTHEDLVKFLMEKCEREKEEAIRRILNPSISEETEVSESRRSSSQRRSSQKSGASSQRRSTRTTMSERISDSMRRSTSVRATLESMRKSLESETTTISSYKPTSEEIRIADEQDVRQILNDIVMAIMQCIATDILKSVQDSMPLLPCEPVNHWTPPREVPVEEIGEGLNKTVFWVCNNLEDDWICLPNVTPKQIDIARRITVGFTGSLDAEMITYPPFPGKEREYLRAQLARINSSTSVSPMGYYIKGVEGEDLDELYADMSKYEEAEDYDDNFDYEDDGIDIRRNPYYKTHSLTQLADGSLHYWVHHRKEIKKDGRVTWWEYDEEQPDEDAGEDGTETEHTIMSESSGSRLPRPLFKPLSKEEIWIGMPRGSWQVSKHPSYLGGPTIVALRSLRWPGGVAYGTMDGKSDYMYVGWGLKFLSKKYVPEPLPAFCEEYPTDEEITEVVDPTVTDEEEQLEEGDPPLRPRKPSEKRSRSGSGVNDSARSSDLMEEEEEDDSKSEESSNSE